MSHTARAERGKCLQTVGGLLEVAGLLSKASQQALVGRAFLMLLRVQDNAQIGCSATPARQEKVISLVWLSKSGEQNQPVANCSLPEIARLDKSNILKSLGETVRNMDALINAQADVPIRAFILSSFGDLDHGTEQSDGSNARFQQRMIPRHNAKAHSPFTGIASVKGMHTNQEKRKAGDNVAHGLDCPNIYSAYQMGLKSDIWVGGKGGVFAAILAVVRAVALGGGVSPGL
ncbi:MAG: hypothetical protein ABL962_05585, partial [Fimbriimonadaceae bacterium]